MAEEEKEEGVKACLIRSNACVGYGLTSYGAAFGRKELMETDSVPTIMLLMLTEILNLGT